MVSIQYRNRAAIFYRLHGSLIFSGAIIQHSIKQVLKLFKLSNAIAKVNNVAGLPIAMLICWAAGCEWHARRPVSMWHENIEDVAR